MMSIEISSEAQELKDAIMDLVELSSIDLYDKMEAFCALVVEYAGMYAELHRKKVMLREREDKM